MNHKSFYPLLTTEEKVDALKYCLLNGHTEDAIGHLCDLLHHVAPGWKFGPFDGVEQIVRYYGEHPIPVIPVDPDRLAAAREEVNARRI